MDERYSINVIDRILTLRSWIVDNTKLLAGLLVLIALMQLHEGIRGLQPSTPKAESPCDNGKITAGRRRFRRKLTTGKGASSRLLGAISGRIYAVDMLPYGHVNRQVKATPNRSMSRPTRTVRFTWNRGGYRTALT